MSVLSLTIFVSVMLALFFVAGFLYHHDFSGGDPMRDSLLPFQKENSHPAPHAPPAEGSSGSPGRRLPRPAERTNSHRS